ncbi:mitochondrial branched-chain alpha-ketoacid dehydrogenase kinase-domain-containing protein [Gorgonomyces haynaldii]|nr:mitochondrial branched-chain alpha-ketoacid dehydrogenase kinase-domain-containing protein [Gorgonomyces haynaldii]
MFSRELLQTIERLAKIPQTSVSLRDMVEFGRIPSPASLFRGSQFLLQELPIRLSHRVVELENLPHGLSDMPGIQRVKNWYTISTQELLAFQLEKFANKYCNLTNGDENIDKHVLRKYNDAFVNVIENIKKRHDPTTTTIAEGVLQLKEHWKKTNSPLQPKSENNLPLPTAIQSFLDNFYMSRIGIRMLLGQHITMTQASKNPRSAPEHYVGIICTQTNLMDVVQDAIENARNVCQDYYGLFDPPPIRIVGQTDLKFMYVPSHLHHMLFELLKNSLRAVVEQYGLDVEYPEIRIVVAQGNEDITIKVSDEGGGIPRSGMPLIWTYMYTTAEKPLLEEDNQRSDFRAPLAGYGYGLPLSRLYARYFGGDLRLISMEGYGTDAYLHLSRLSDSSEPLP